MKKRRKLFGKTCSSCGETGPVELASGICALCLSAKAWTGFASQPLVIGREEVDRAAAAKAPRPKRLAWILHTSLALLSTAMLVFLALAIRDALTPIPIGTLSSIMNSIANTSSRVLWIAVLVLLLGIFGAVALRRSSHIRSLSLFALQSAAIVSGLAALAFGYISGLGAQSDHIPYTSMPVLSQLDGMGISPTTSRIAESTVVVLAPDGDGDGRAAALGTGAIIVSQPDNAWIITCSHVAIPYISTGAVRKPSEMHPVWVEFSDGRGAIGTIVWAAPPPLDVVAISIAIDSPPPAVEISPSTESLEPDSPVAFVPNPLLHGWQVHNGKVIARKSHDTPAGEFALVLTSLPVLPGDSGSGLFDDKGRLVGLNTWTSYTETGSQGISLPSEVLLSLEKAIKTGNLESLVP